ncbi:hypothetical protein HPP92_006465 [Vanilla planifolia]|uniref:Uncharacterized protein n=1 Tax=Vanilla planifolia TaxID=51239 RepID=A0A835RPD6_VANPL|nr:hypothetical protein HPP92_006465 [Vanilla planifolia]
MGNSLVITPCFRPPSHHASSAILVFHGGSIRQLAGHHVAGEIMFDFPDSIICRSDGFYIGHPLPALSLADELHGGETYFVLPAGHFPGKVVTAASLAALSSTRPALLLAGGGAGCPFEYLKGGDGRAQIRVLPEFIMRVMGNGGEGEKEGGGVAVREEICSTPELKRQYEQLVGPRGNKNWSPRLETISECSKRRMSAGRFCSVAPMGSIHLSCCRS